MKRWYLLYCKRGEQQRAKIHLENQNVECFYPEVCVEKILRGKRQMVQEPLFPSYMFVRFDFEHGPSFTTVRSTRGVVDFVRLGPHPRELQGDLIYQLKQLDCEQNEESGEAITRERGKLFEWARGPFAGIEAIYQEPDGDTRSIMLVKMISQQVPMSIENTDWEIS
ncbi:transcriptional regulator [Vibrio metoecus]|uniref:Transcription antitermination protein RfaH n=1 Tax=Vibrio metoecus TaxID=1481663 RepID=A0ABR4RYY0_VIBMT|nr:transcriptional regulator [Vibrio metoecus]